jgi:hypothetical protein
MSTQKFNHEFPSEVAHIDDEECFYALVDDTVTSHDGYSEREGGGYSTSRYIDIVRLGNREQATAWLLAEEESKQRQYYTPKTFKIVLMKPIHVQRTVSISL